MKLGVIYLLTHPRMASRLVVSIFGLRRWYSGPITLFTTQLVSGLFGELIESDERLNVEHRTIEEIESETPARTACRMKVRLALETPYDVTIYLDADTLVMDSIEKLIEASIEHSLVVTPFGNQSTTDRFALSVWPSWRREIEASSIWNELIPLTEKSPQSPRWLPLVEEVAVNSQPLINNGMVAFHKNQAFLHDWQELAEIGARAISPDESSLQLLLLKYPYFLIGNEFNCMPEIRTMAGYRPLVDPAKAKILHFVCSSHLDHPWGQRYWLPAFEECCRLKIAHIDRWQTVDLEVKEKSARRPRRKLTDANGGIHEQT